MTNPNEAPIADQLADMYERWDPKNTGPKDEGNRMTKHVSLKRYRANNEPSKAELRISANNMVEAYLANGGQIKQIG